MIDTVDTVDTVHTVHTVHTVDMMNRIDGIDTPRRREQRKMNKCVSYCVQCRCSMLVFSGLTMGDVKTIARTHHHVPQGLKGGKRKEGKTEGCQLH